MNAIKITLMISLFGFLSVASATDTEREIQELRKFQKRYWHVHLPFYDEIVEVNRSFAPSEEEGKKAHRVLFIPKNIKEIMTEQERTIEEFRRLSIQPDRPLLGDIQAESLIRFPSYGALSESQQADPHMEQQQRDLQSSRQDEGRRGCCQGFCCIIL
jgi:hypothetical protein